MQLRLALAQIPETKDIAVNLQTVLQAIDYAAGEGAQLLLTPEGCLSGYTHRFDATALDAALVQVEEAARSRGVGLALGTCRYEADGLCYNELRFYQPDGAFLGFHAKTLLCGSLDEPSQGEINHYATAPLRVFSFCGIPIAGLICNDLWANPGCTPQVHGNLSHQLARMGAKLILHAVNGGRDDSELSRVTVKRYHETNVLLRALAADIPIATVDNAYPVDQPVSAIGGIAGPEGRWLLTLPETGVQYAAYTLEL